jgi:predicted  nucleic acid-binding Zn-ribbon protein
MSIAADLYSLQEIDIAVDRAVQRHQEIEDALEETEELKEARQESEERTKVSDALKGRQAELETEVEDIRAKAGEVEKKLYSGTVTNPKELSDLDADVKAIKAQAGRREDVLLSLLVELEEAEASRLESTAAYSEIESSWRVKHEELLVEKAGLEPERDQLQAKRDARATTIDKSALSLYKVLRERKGGVGVARVEQGMCQGCRITLPAAVLQRARGAGVVQCVSCERILLVT